MKLSLCIFSFSLISCNAFLSYYHKISFSERILPVNGRKKNIEKDIYEEYHELSSERSVKKKPPLFKAKTDTQKLYYRDINNDEMKIIVATGPAGTGKTLFPTQHVAKLLKETNLKIVFTRPLISVDEELGYLPGDINQKMDPWIIPIFDVLRDFFTQKEINFFIAEKYIEIVPLAFMRGRTFKNTFIIGDELQNTSNRQLLMLLTRLGENSKMVITGDVNQCDNNENGLMDLLNKIEKHSVDYEGLRKKGIALVEFTNSDIQRSPIIETILDIYKDTNSSA
jgi:phosphate starvation-inducible PhoH-like protein